MKVDKFTYGAAEGSLYEAMRIKAKNGRIEPERENKAIIHPELTHLNKTVTHHCIAPLAAHAPEKGYVRGTDIAEYHNSQVSNKYLGARIQGKEKAQSKAIGFIVTLPKDYLDELIPGLADDEYEYLTKKLEAEGNHQPFKKDEAMESTLKAKFTSLNLNEENIPKIESFLLTAKDCVLEEMGIRKEDVLFYSIHLDESFPHIHCMALPTCEKVYETDVYAKRARKDGTHTLLHKKGDREITYSASKFYEKDLEGTYTFFRDFHPHIVDRMREKGFDASGLLNGITSGKGFSPQNMNRQQREESVEMSRIILSLRKKEKELERLKAENEKLIAEKDAEITKLQADVETIRADKTAMQTEFEETKERFTGELKSTLNKVAEANRERDDIAAELEYMQIEQRSLKALTKELMDSIKELADTILGFIPRLVKDLMTEWKSLRFKQEREAFEADLAAKATRKANADRDIQSIYAPIKDVAEAAKAMVDKEIINGVDMSRFDSKDINGNFIQKTNFATKQIRKVAAADDREDDFGDGSEALKIALRDWFNREKYEPIIRGMSPEDATEYVKTSQRAERAYEAALESLKEQENDLDR